MQVFLDSGCHGWHQAVGDYANQSFMAVYEELKAIDPELLNKVMPGYCERLRYARCKPGGMTHAIRITATNERLEPSRLKRLRAVINGLRQLPDSPVWKIGSLHDHKGDLSVTWREAPTGNDLTGVQYVWHSPIGDGVGNINHQFMGQDVRLMTQGTTRGI